MFRLKEVKHARSIEFHLTQRPAIAFGAIREIAIVLAACDRCETRRQRPH